MGEPSLYAVLGIAKRASAQDLKRAYYALAHQFHPDKHPDDPAATARFREASFAYTILSDKKRRTLYDRFGRFGLKLMPDAPRGRGELTPQGALRSVVDALAEEVRTRLHGFERKLRDLTRGEDEHLSVNVAPTLLLCGGQIELRVRRATACGPCEASGARSRADRSPCRFCQGRGQWHISWGGIDQTQPCALCQGRGFRVTKRCHACGGKGMQYPFITLNLRIPAKTSTSRTLKLAEQGGIARQPGGQRGDLLVHLRAVSDSILRVDGNNLSLEWPLTPREAVLGGPVRIPMPDGVIEVQIPAETQPGDRVRVEDAGLYNEHMLRGHLTVQAQIEMPVNVSETSRAQWQVVVDTDEQYPKRRAAQLSLRGPLASSESPKEPR